MAVRVKLLGSSFSSEAALNDEADGRDFASLPTTATHLVQSLNRWKQKREKRKGTKKQQQRRHGYFFTDVPSTDLIYTWSVCNFFFFRQRPLWHGVAGFVGGHVQAAALRSAFGGVVFFHLLWTKSLKINCTPICGEKQAVSISFFLTPQGLCSSLPLLQRNWLSRSVATRGRCHYLSKKGNQGRSFRWVSCLSYFCFTTTRCLLLLLFCSCTPHSLSSACPFSFLFTNQLKTPP